ncbi:U-box domain-containing protein 15-like [Lycium ferocissimum]|uniref:U-box domain-containing protein 15-like n=1 Tax=Lycium ferocissimum TaxID=112874 RepID=UPI0028160E43|nr:U-box domain-containing protein 15-like [Lycium ferocissimum]
MAMGRDHELEEGVTVEEEFGSSCQTSPQDKQELVRELIGVIHTVGSYEEYRRSQREECHKLVERLKLLLPLFDEIRDFEGQIPESGIECLMKLKKAFSSAKKLLKTCHCGSKIYLAIESEAVLGRFHSVYERLSQALEGIPYDELGISDEEKEQVELLRVQFRRAVRRNDSQDMELAMDLMVALSTNNDRNADSASIDRLGHKLGLCTIDDLKVETISVKEKVAMRKRRKKLWVFYKFRRFAGLEETELLMPKAHEKSTSLAIPNEFLCPITLEIMTDPVTVSTGQTYEKENIKQLLDSNCQTCPKTGKILEHLLLAPNFVLKNLIQQWCEKNNFQLPIKQAPPKPESPSVEIDGHFLSLIQDLSSNQLEVQRKAVKAIRMLSKENPENRTLIVNHGGIPPLVQLLSYPDSRIQEHAVTALLNLSIDETNKKLISKEEPIPAIIEILQNGNIGAKENSAAALFSLSMLDENKEAIGSLNGIAPLIDLLSNGTIRGKKDAITALFNLCFSDQNVHLATEAGMIAPLFQLLEKKNLEMIDEALSILLLLAAHPDGRQEMGKLSFIETLVNLIRDGTPKNKECSVAVLHKLSTHNSNLMLAALQYGVYEHLVEISDNGTERGQRKAKSILQLMSKTEQIP